MILRTLILFVNTSTRVVYDGDDSNEGYMTEIMKTWQYPSTGLLKLDHFSVCQVNIAQQRKIWHGKDSESVFTCAGHGPNIIEDHIEAKVPFKRPRIVF